ncbi:MAG: NAD(P)/FAD-dependent oxidoreductase [Gammaproteobacteria bacterium]|nr:NAD(P)/FAD-dependent oxidoreductase [Gammaproteobacteria bacterium]
MDQSITRRDFIHDTGLAALGLALPLPALALAPNAAADDYPPVRTGLRGSHPGAFEVAHALAREGGRFEDPRALDETYDLVVVGGGISGLASAYFHGKLHGAASRVLVLDNHDDFGGHAKRNEFHQGGPMRLAWGGTVNMEYKYFSPTVLGLLAELGIDLKRLQKDSDFDWLGPHGHLKPAILFHAARYRRDVLLPGVTLDGMAPKALARHVDAFPIPADARARFKAFLLAGGDVIGGMSPAERHAYLHGTRYTDFLRQHFSMPDEAVQVLSNAPAGFWGLPAESLSVAECLGTASPGAHVLGGPNDEDTEPRESPTAMFPDGNGSIARLLVRSLIPAFTPGMPTGADAFGIVTTHPDYAALDRAGSPVRLRLGATAVHVANATDGASVTIDYVKNGQLLRVTAKRAVLACYNAMIPHLAPGLPAAQKAALAKCVKRPMLVVNTLLRNGHALQSLGIKGAELPGSFLQTLFLVTGVNVGDYRPAWRPEDPCVMQSFAAFCTPPAPGVGVADQARIDRARMLNMSFEDYEREVRTVLGSLLGRGGFDAARDILAITVNRWPHGYARDHLDLEDADWNVSPPPEVVGRQRYGRIAIANSDAGANAYTHEAIDQAWRAVNELALGT